MSRAFLGSPNDVSESGSEDFCDALSDVEAKAKQMPYYPRLNAYKRRLLLYGVTAWHLLLSKAPGPHRIDAIGLLQVTHPRYRRRE